MVNKIEKFITEIRNKIQNLMIKDKDINMYIRERRGNFVSNVKYILFPKTTLEVSQILKIANAFNINIIPQSGNTGLVGGTVGDDDDVIVNLSLMNKIIKLDKINKSVLLESGVILYDLNKYLKKYNLEFPLYLPSYKECLIGGNIATNAGGINTIFSGNTKDLLLGVEYVLANGDIINDVHTLRKRNIGFDLKNLVAGMEGTLGIITKACLKVTYLQKHQINVLIGVVEKKIIEKILKNFDYEWGNFIHAFELMNKESIVIANKISKIKIKNISNYNLLIQLKTNSIDFREMLTKKINNILDIMMANNQLEYFSITKNAKIWELRNKIPEAQNLLGYNLKNDFALPISKIFTCLNRIENTVKKINKNYLIVVFGHLGDGNLHINIIDVENKNNLKANKDSIRETLINIVMSLGGTFSAEHGIGIINKNNVKKYHTDGLKIMEKIKTILDEKIILNKNKLI